MITEAILLFPPAAAACYIAGDALWQYGARHGRAWIERAGELLVSLSVALLAADAVLLAEVMSGPILTVWGG